MQRLVDYLMHTGGHAHYTRSVQIEREMAAAAKHKIMRTLGKKTGLNLSRLHLQEAQRGAEPALRQLPPSRGRKMLQPRMPTQHRKVHCGSHHESSSIPQGKQLRTYTLQLCVSLPRAPPTWLRQFVISNSSKGITPRTEPHCQVTALVLPKQTTLSACTSLQAPSSHLDSTLPRMVLHGAFTSICQAPDMLASRQAAVLVCACLLTSLQAT